LCESHQPLSSLLSPFPFPLSLTSIRMSSYRDPGDNIFTADGKLYIPVTQQRPYPYADPETVTFTFVGPSEKKVMKGEDVQIRKIVEAVRGDKLKAPLQTLAKVLGIRGVSKMKAAELYDAVWSRVVFE
jgi:hypothetical protein